MKKNQNRIFKALKYAFPYTLPILAGFAFLGLAYGIYMNAAGFSAIYPFATSLCIFGGSLEFLCVSLMSGSFAPLSAFIVAVMIQARHLFYGISMLDKYKDMGWKKPYLIFGLIDETFSINYIAKIPEDVDKSWFFMWVTVLNHLFWISGATLGGLIGHLIPISIEGIDFVMTSMFVVFFVDQLLKDRQKISAVIGVFGSLVCLIIFGADSFIIPSMLVILLLLALFKKPIETRMGQTSEGGRES